MTHFWVTKSLKGGHFFLIKDWEQVLEVFVKDDFFEDLYFD